VPTNAHPCSAARPSGNALSPSRKRSALPKNRYNVAIMESFGYAGRILRVDLSSGRIDAIPTSDYADRFLGGRGIATII